ncbi:MAG: DegV family protein [Phoenicibacter congonensis]|uniref:DegV family protein n=1 Tax=Phoenicibacter congonensis TaxID=1944646 RepID=A0AA43RJT0_9ACTN|nr:DegV family protein [Phoenicibacter congonensis]
MRKCNLIIDSICDLPADYVDAEGVTLLRVPYFIDGVAYEDDMFTEQSPRDFYDKIRQGKTPTTAQIPLHTFLTAFEKVAEEGTPTVFLSFTSALSGSFEASLLAREQILAEHPDVEIYCVDTKLPSIAEGLFVIEAINQMNEGLTASEMVAWAEEARYYVDALFMVDDLESLKRGGRIPASAAIAGAKLDVKPMLTIDPDGALKIAGIARGRKKGIRQLEEYYTKNAPEDYNGVVIIGDADCKKESDKLHDMIVKKKDSLIIVTTNIGPVIGTHVGPGMLAIVFWGEDRRQKMSITDKIAKKVKGSKE